MLLEYGRPVVATSELEMISPRYPTGRWPEGVVVADRYDLPIDPALPAGAYVLHIAVLDGETEIAAQTIRSNWRLKRSPLCLHWTSMQHPAGVTYGDEMRLLGYDLAREGDRLEVAL